MNHIVVGVMVLAAVAMSLPAQAGVGDPAAVVGELGGFLWKELNIVECRPGSYLGGNTGVGQFGMMWDGPAMVYSVTIAQGFDTGKADYPNGTTQLPRTVAVYTGPDPVKDYAGSFTLAYDRDHPQTIQFSAALGGPVFAKNSYLMLVVTEMYSHPDPGASYEERVNHPYGIQNYTGFCVDSFGFDARSTGVEDVNYNLNATLSSNRPRDARDSFLTAGNDGILRSYRDGDDAAYWEITRGPLSITATYNDEAKEIGSIGLAFAGDATTRACPKWFIVSDDHGNSQPIPLSEVTSQYGRYDLDPAIFTEKITKLTVTFPEWGDDWWRGVGASDVSWFGIMEFQAFAPLPPVPEPATMSLLALGGLALLRRR